MSFLVIARKKMKARAPSPPQEPRPAPRNIFRTPAPEGGNPGTDAKENILRPRVHLQVTLPQGYQTSVTEDGRWLLHWQSAEWEHFAWFGSVWVAMPEGHCQRGHHLRLSRLCPWEWPKKVDDVSPADTICPYDLWWGWELGKIKSWFF